MFENVFLVLPGKEELVSPYGLYEGLSKPIKAAQPFTVTLVSVVVAEDLDGLFRGKNDILVLTRSSLGEQPLVQRVHFYGREIPKGLPIRNMFANNVFVSEDYSGKEKLWLELNILEIDRDDGDRRTAISAFESLAGTAGAVFPAVLPYAFGTALMGKVIERLVSAFEKDTDVVKVPFALHPGTARPGQAPFQEGSYVAFARPQNPVKYRLHANGLLSVNDRPSEVSYVVFNIVPEKEFSGKFVVSQKIATLLTQIDAGNNNSARNTIEFLNDTITAYSNFKRLERYLALKALASPSADEKALIEEISRIEELKAFLPRK